MENKRNDCLDMIRGLGIILVVMGHSLLFFYEEAEKSLLFSAIWSLQMPLFMLVSGYVTKYSKRLGDIKTLALFLGKRTVSYMVPWAMWCFVVKPLFFGKSMDLIYLLYNMDSGYWFLATLWAINVGYGIARYFADKQSNELYHMAILLGVYGVFCIILVGIGMATSFSFLGIKFILYYSVFYMAGVIWSKVEKRISIRMKDIVCSASALLWLVLIRQFNTYVLPDEPIYIAIRAISSFVGCIFVSYGIAKIRGGKVLAWLGTHSLEIYLSHFSLLNLTVFAGMNINSGAGALTFVVNVVCTLILASMIAWFTGKYELLRLLLWGKR